MRTESAITNNTFDATEFEQNALKESNKIALGMGVFSVGTLLACILIAQLLHSL